MQDWLYLADRFRGRDRLEGVHGSWARQQYEWLRCAEIVRRYRRLLDMEAARMES